MAHFPFPLQEMHQPQIRTKWHLFKLITGHTQLNVIFMKIQIQIFKMLINSNYHLVYG